MNSRNTRDCSELLRMNATADLVSAWVVYGACHFELALRHRGPAWLHLVQICG